MTRNPWLVGCFAASLAAAACGDGDDSGDDDVAPTVDAAVDTDAPATPDAGATLAACDLFDEPAGTIDAIPGEFSGDVNNGTTLMELTEGDCAAENAPFGVAVPGPEQVIRVNNLTSGQAYRVSLDAAFDSAVYVATACAGGDGPTAGECLAFTDTIDNPEFAAWTTPTFVAPVDGTVWIVVDFFDPSNPETGTYTVSVDEAECLVDGDCTADPNLPACVNFECAECNDDDDCADTPDTPGCSIAAGVCVECIVNDHCSDTPDTPFCVGETCSECATSFDCDTVELPVCDVGTCAAGSDMCTSDDGTENGDDGPAGAVALTNGVAGSAAVCNTPATESDFFVYTASAGEDIRITLDSGDGSDLGVEVFAADGTPFGTLDTANDPEIGLLTDLEAGDVFFRVFLTASPAVTVASPYTLLIDPPGCTWDVECRTPGLPKCGPELECIASAATACTGDDAVENDDDGAGLGTDATPTLDDATGTVINAGICSSPQTGNTLTDENDWYRITVGAGETLDITLTWTGTDDLDIFLVDEDLNVIDDSLFGTEIETISATDLPAAEYYLLVHYFDPTDVVAAFPYTLTVKRTTVP